MSSEYPDKAQPQGQPQVDPEYAHRKKLIYRAKQRGWLEVDLLLGSWAMDHVMDLNKTQLGEFEDILNQETLDIFHLISGQEKEVPSDLDTQVLGMLKEYALEAKMASAEGYRAMKHKMSN